MHDVKKSHEDVGERLVNTVKETTGLSNKKGHKPSLASKLLVISLILVSLTLTGWMGVGLFREIRSDSLVKDSQFQAVFLEDGQIYFGELSDIEKDYVKLENIFYLRVQQTIQPEQEDPNAEPSEQPQTQLVLVKLGDEPHGPEDEMFINKEKILFWENIRNDGDVVEQIVEYYKNPPEAQE